MHFTLYDCLLLSVLLLFGKFLLMLLSFCPVPLLPVAACGSGSAVPYNHVETGVQGYV